jgi:hypothetical protein
MRDSGGKVRRPNGGVPTAALLRRQRPSYAAAVCHRRSPPPFAAAVSRFESQGTGIPALSNEGLGRLRSTEDRCGTRTCTRVRTS